MTTKVSLITTVLDASDRIGPFLESVSWQTRPPDEVVVVDGGSTDGTLEQLRSADAVTLVERPGANIARGRNIAISAATHDVMVWFCGLASPELHVARVRLRVTAGGHDIPDATLRARFPRTLAKLRAAVPLVDEAFLFDNSSFETPYRIVAVYRRGLVVSRHPPLPAWTRGLP